MYFCPGKGCVKVYEEVKDVVRRKVTEGLLGRTVILSSVFVLEKKDRVGEKNVGSAVPLQQNYTPAVYYEESC